MDIQEIAKEKLQLIIDNGTFDTLIEKQLTDTCKSIVSDLFRDYSEFGKELKKTLQEKMVVNLNQLNIGMYTTMICRTIEESTEGVLEEVKQRVRKHTAEVLEVPEKKDWKLSELVKAYRGLEDDHDADKVVVEVDDERYGSIWVRIGKEVKKSYSYSTPTQNYEIRMLVDKKTKVIHNVWYQDSLINPRIKKIYKRDIENLLAKLWINECTLELDTEDAEYEGSKGHYED